MMMMVTRKIDGDDDEFVVRVCVHVCVCVFVSVCCSMCMCACVFLLVHVNGAAGIANTPMQVKSNST